MWYFRTQWVLSVSDSCVGSDVEFHDKACYGMCAAEDLEAEQDEMESSVGSMLGLLDTSPAGATPKTGRHHASGATGGRSGLKLRRHTHDKTTKSLESSEPERKKSCRKLSQSSAGSVSYTHLTLPTNREV